MRINKRNKKYTQGLGPNYLWLLQNGPSLVTQSWAQAQALLQQTATIEVIQN